MAKKPGLQSEFQLEVDEGAFGQPAHVPDYLDRAFRPTAPVPSPAAPTTQPAKPRVEPRTAQPLPVPPRVHRQEEAVAAGERPDRRELPPELERPRPRLESPRRAPPPAQRRAERRELSIDAETSRMIDRVVSDLQEKTPQKDVTASEFARAIIQLADESRHHQDFTHVNRRGQWGSPTARAFIADLKKSFLRAVGRHFIEHHPQEAFDFYRQVHLDETEDGRR